MVKTSDKNVFDVAKPGKSAPGPTSRPIITSHGPMLSDPMVSDNRADNRSTDNTAPAVKSVPKMIEPSDSFRPERSGDFNHYSVDEAELRAGHAKESSSKTGLELTDKAGKEITDGNVANQVMQSHSDTSAQEDIERQQLVDGLIEAGTYFLPIGQVTRQRNNRRLVAVLLTVLVLAMVSSYLVIGVGILEPDL